MKNDTRYLMPSRIYLFIAVFVDKRSNKRKPSDKVIIENCTEKYQKH